MKKLILSLVFIVSAIGATELKAQYNIIKTDLSLLNPTKHHSIHFEHTINWNTSIEMGVGLFNDDIEKISASHFCFTVKKYIKRNAPKGLYYGIYNSIESYNIIDESFTVSNSLGILGYQFIIRESLTIDLWYGYGYSLVMPASGISQIPSSLGITPFTPLEYGLKIGFAIPKGVPFIGGYF
jgi:hypothetical protein